MCRIDCERAFAPHQVALIVAQRSELPTPDNAAHGFIAAQGLATFPPNEREVHLRSPLFDTAQ